MRTLPLFLAITGCTSPVEIAGELARELSTDRVEAVGARLHPDYSDPLGDGPKLLADLRELSEAGPLSVRWTELEAVRSPGGATVLGKAELELSGAPSWTLIGPVALELTDGRAVRSGLLSDLRELRALFAARRAGLEANDADAIGQLLHPEYRDGDLDKAAALARLRADLAGIPIRIEPRSYWAEVRGLDAHVDERYTLTLGERSHAAIARFTLRKAAGRWRIWAGMYPSTSE